MNRLRDPYELFDLDERKHLHECSSLDEAKADAEHLHKPIRVTSTRSDPLDEVLIYEPALGWLKREPDPKLRFYHCDPQRPLSDWLKAIADQVNRWFPNIEYASSSLRNQVEERVLDNLRGRLVTYAVRGDSEGWYIHLEHRTREKQGWLGETLLLVKTLHNAHHALDINNFLTLTVWGT